MKTTLISDVKMVKTFYKNSPICKISFVKRKHTHTNTNTQKLSFDKICFFICLLLKWYHFFPESFIDHRNL